MYYRGKVKGNRLGSVFGLPVDLSGAAYIARTQSDGTAPKEYNSLSRLGGHRSLYPHVTSRDGNPGERVVSTLPLEFVKPLLCHSTTVVTIVTTPWSQRLLFVP